MPKVLFVPLFRIPPKAAFPPARENGLDATAVPNTLADAGAPKVAKSVTTLREGDIGGELDSGDDRGGLSEIRGGTVGAYGEYE